MGSATYGYPPADSCTIEFLRLSFLLMTLKTLGFLNMISPRGGNQNLWVPATKFQGGNQVWFTHSDTIGRTGNDVSGHYKRHYFLFFLFSFFFFFFFSSPSSTFLIEGVLGSKNLFSES